MIRILTLAAVELLAAVLLARLIVSSDEARNSSRHGGHESMDPGSMPVALVPNWGWGEYVATAVAILGLAGWLARRHCVAAVMAAAGLAVLATSAPVRILATQSHLIAMVALEVLLVIGPLLALRAVPMPVETQGESRFRLSANVVTGAAGLLYGGLVIAVHVPALHRDASERGVVPLWVALLALVTGLAYWLAVLRTGDRVSVRTRRSVLIGAQEVAAFIGLLSLFGAWGAMAHTNPLGLSAATDQRLGGLLMMFTCGAVAIPIAGRLRGSPAT